MAEEKSRAEQEAQADSDARYGRQPDPQGGQYYTNMYNLKVAEYQKQNEQPAPE